MIPSISEDPNQPSNQRDWKDRWVSQGYFILRLPDIAPDRNRELRPLFSVELICSLFLASVIYVQRITMNNSILWRNFSWGEIVKSLLCCSLWHSKLRRLGTKSKPIRIAILQ